MAIIEYQFSKPTSIVGNIITWRTGGMYSHAWVVIDGVQYDPMPLRSKRHKPCIYNPDLIIHLEVTDEEKVILKDYCEKWVGTYYDFLAIFGWFLGIKAIDGKNETYCFEFCNETLNLMKNEKVHKKGLISDEHLALRLMEFGGKVVKGQMD